MFEELVQFLNFYDVFTQGILILYPKPIYIFYRGNLTSQGSIILPGKVNFVRVKVSIYEDLPEFI